jgi:beta-N-acetylhexosaminidase
MTGLLRGEMGYTGLLVTDSLEMGALQSSGFAPPTAAAAALAAGADVLLMGDPRSQSADGPNVQFQAYQRVLDDMRHGKVPRTRLDEAVRHVLLLKARFGILARRPADPAAVAGHAGAAGHHDLSRAIASQAITLLRDDARQLPLAIGSRAVVVETPPAAGLGRRLGLPAIAIGIKPAIAEIDAVVARTQGPGPIVVASANAAANPGQARLVNALLAAGAPVIVAAVAGPYDLLQFPQAPTYIASYGSTPPLLEALADVLLGKAAATGPLPVELPGLYGIGAGAGMP